MMARDRPFAMLIGLVSPFLVWSLAFIALYALHSIACAAGWATGGGAIGVRAALILTWLVHAAAAGGLVVWFRRGPADGAPAAAFLRSASLAMAVVGAVATLWLGLPLVLLRLCV